MSSTLLECVLNDLVQLHEGMALAIDDIELGASFIVVKLSNGSIGSSLNFCVQNGDLNFDPVRARHECLRNRNDDPLLLRFAGSDRHLEAGVAVAVATALSQPLLEKPPPSPLRVKSISCWQQDLAKQVRPTDRVCQIGFGGSVDLFGRTGLVKEFIVCDLGFADDQEMSRARMIMRERGMDADSVVFRPSALDPPVLERADVVCITGSTLCNATLDGILDRIRNARLVVLQGPSCSLYAPALFRAGVTMMYVPLKQPREWDLAMEHSALLTDFVDGKYVVVTPKIP